MAVVVKLRVRTGAGVGIRVILDELIVGSVTPTRRSAESVVATKSLGACELLPSSGAAKDLSTVVPFTSRVEIVVPVGVKVIVEVDTII